jgi:two-component system, NtrC family, response regulator GlrR
MAQGPRGATITVVRRDLVRVPDVVIEVKAPSGATVSTTLGLAEVVIGMAEDVELRVDDPRISRRHASLQMDERGLLVTDLGSKNGTWIDGVEVRAAYAPPEGTIKVGETTLRYRLEGEHEVALSPRASFGEAIGGSIVMRALFARLEASAATEQTMLLLGESGTGKELLARAIHGASSRRDGPFVVVDCGSIPEGLIEAELFGQVRGAFTGADGDRAGVFEQANGGTLFLDEIGELPLAMQSRLLRALEERAVKRVGASTFTSVDVRIIAATHRDLSAMVRSNAFRQDLYYRLAVIRDRVPALRERLSDIELLAERYLATLEPKRTLADLPTHTLAMLRSHAFPGNVRELFNVLARLAVFPELGRDALDSSLEGESGSAGDPLHLSLGWREARDRALDQFEASYLHAQLARHEGNVARTATMIGVSRQFLYRLLERHSMVTGGRGP